MAGENNATVFSVLRPGDGRVASASNSLEQKSGDGDEVENPRGDDDGCGRDGPR